jgi:hypothetical protein
MLVGLPFRIRLNFLERRPELTFKSPAMADLLIVLSSDIHTMYRHPTNDYGCTFASEAK